MTLKIVCSGQLVRHPLGGHCWHHLQYLVGLKRMGHAVTFFEDYGWPNSCYDADRHDMTDDPTYGIAFMTALFEPHGLNGDWCYLAADGTAHGMPRDELAQRCRECDLYLNLSNINWVPEIELCRRRVLVDTDPVFTQIGRFGMGGPFDRYHACFTYGENVHRPGADMPTGAHRWFPTRQPVVADLWPVGPTAMPDVGAAWTSVMNWSAYGGGDVTVGGRVYGQKAREFEAVFDLPRAVATPMELAVSPPAGVRQRLADNGWRLTDPLSVTRSPESYQRYIRRSRGEFSVAKHGYVSTRSGWFSDRTCGYLASGRPAVVQDTGFSDFLPTGAGLIAWRDRGEAIAGIRKVEADYSAHCRAARAVAEEHFGAAAVLRRLLEVALDGYGPVRLGSAGDRSTDPKTGAVT